MRLGGSVRLKVFSVSALFLAALVGAATGILWLVVHPSFLNLEAAGARDHGTLIETILRRDIADLDALVWDWASWDDTYTYVIDRNSAYETSNLVASTYTGTSIDLIAIYDASGRPVWSRQYDLESQAFVQTWEFQIRSPLVLRLQARMLASPDGFHGLLTSSRGLMMIAARPILTSQDEGPSVGMLVMGRSLSERLLADLGAATGSALKAWSPDDPDLPPAARQSLSLHAEERIQIRPRNDDTTDVYVGFSDVFDGPAQVLGTTLPRDIAAAGTAAVASAAALIAAAGSVLIAVFLGCQQFVVLGPLNTLTRHIQGVADSGELNRDIDMPRKDELGTLARAFNHMQARIAQLAYFDTVTGLPNRRLFEDRADQILRNARRTGNRMAILFLDLDTFKAINDTRGHSVGDALLHAVARELDALVRASDTVARFGGDEFVIVLRELTGRAQANELAERLLDRFALPIQAGPDALFTGVSIGVAVYPEDGATIETLVAHADAAMYQAKRDGGHRAAAYDAIRHQDTTAELDLAQAFRDALVADRLFLEFQPQVDLATGAVVAHEALVRWRHPERGVLKAEAFIQVADQGNLYALLDAWVLTAACAALAQSLANAQNGPRLERIAVNIHGAHAASENLPAFVDAVLKDMNLPPDRLTLEIAERVLIGRTDTVAPVLTALRAMGVRIAIDDFGAGRVAIEALRQCPADVIKLNRTFVTDVPGDTVAEAILSATLTLADALNLSVVAVGVETAEQRDALRTAGCRRAQGYFLGG
ncbi:EAL domain-containing protein [Roseospira marina]|uniref:EAL domain-containing protein n=1 Tax=Roseospira marina TaxID=140057 RepID=A0A5M6IER6_9PROT|nr:EAL domain-containing protein [Roseospira marina]KAA5606754.1 EAL domain-containing protein [Roseospira marina]MBB4313826.1 diguanylate cyclase (GGDEF)-like protein [Roseospira marina]MBB5086988.1 diguanylate cyclase (GGDEF)-like protein [Roseospira marina]